MELTERELARLEHIGAGELSEEIPAAAIALDEIVSIVRLDILTEIMADAPGLGGGRKRRTSEPLEAY